MIRNRDPLAVVVARATRHEIERACRALAHELSDHEIAALVGLAAWDVRRAISAHQSTAHEAQE